MTVKTESKIEFIHFIDHVVDGMGEKIEGVLPLLSILEKTKSNSAEYHLLNRLWTDWCDYLET